MTRNPLSSQRDRKGKASSSQRARVAVAPDDSLLVSLATKRRGDQYRAEVEYDEHIQMSRMANQKTLAIDYRGPKPPVTKKFDVEKGEDQKDRW